MNEYIAVEVGSNQLGNTYSFVPESWENIPFGNYRINPKFPLDTTALSLSFRQGYEREIPGVPQIGGEASLVLSYKGKPGFIISYRANASDLWIVQLQGTKKAGYPIASSLNVAKFFAHQTRRIVEHPDNIFFRRVVMRPPISIEGTCSTYTGEYALKRYDQLRQELFMQYSESENAYVTDVQ